MAAAVFWPAGSIAHGQPWLFLAVFLICTIAITYYLLWNDRRLNNLKNTSLDIPKHKITVFTGISGSGKSSLVFDTIAAEAQRQLNETFTAFVQGFLPSYDQPDVDHIENLNAPIIINQKRVGGGSRSTVGTYTDIAALLRLLFSRAGQPHAVAGVMQTQGIYQDG